MKEAIIFIPQTQYQQCCVGDDGYLWLRLPAHVADALFLLLSKLTFQQLLNMGLTEKRASHIHEIMHSLY